MSPTGFFPSLVVAEGPNHLFPGHTLQEHSLRSAEFLWVQAVVDTAVALTLRILFTPLSDPLKHPDSVYLLQGSSANPVPRRASPFRHCLPPLWRPCINLSSTQDM